jgi:hypothetical protein
VTEVIPVIIGGGVKALKVCARAERESQDRQNKYSHHLGVRAERCLMRLSGLNHAQAMPVDVFTVTRRVAHGCSGNIAFAVLPDQIDAHFNFTAGMHDVKHRVDVALCVGAHAPIRAALRLQASPWSAGWSLTTILLAKRNSTKRGSA